MNIRGRILKLCATKKVLLVALLASCTASVANSQILSGGQVAGHAQNAGFQGNDLTYAVAYVGNPIFNNTGSLANARSGHTATLLSDGKVLVAGGNGVSHVVIAELCDPASGIWTATGSLAIGRSAHTATLLPNGKVLVAGGSSSDIASAELYNPTSGLGRPPGA